MTDPLCHFVRQHSRLFVLSGAGVSTPSRIPDYRDEQGRWKRVAAAMEALEQSDAMLVVGSSLMLYSEYRFCEGAHRSEKPIAAVNIGRTRADHLFEVKIERPCAEVLVDLARTVTSNPFCR